MIRQNYMMRVGLLVGAVTAVLAACQAAPEPQVVEVTRVVTETIIETVTVEGEPQEVIVEVTRVVEVMEADSPTEAEEEYAPAEGQDIQPGGDLPFSTGSEADAIPLPTPDTGPKVNVTRTSAEVAFTAAAEGELRAETEPVLNVALAESSRLSAGEVDDNAQWAAYLAYIQAYQGAEVIPVDVSERHLFQVTDTQGRPVPGALLTIEAQGDIVTQLRTHSDGTAYFFPRAYHNQAQAYTVSMIVADEVISWPVNAGGPGQTWPFVVPPVVRPDMPVALDVLILIDTTGSMDDELRQLKDNILAIAMQINALPSQPDTRLALVSYRDQTDDDVITVFDFTRDINTFMAALTAVEAGGGGDYPEDLNMALSQAIHETQWRGEDSVSLIFLIADAPPHLDYGQENHYAYEMLQAAAQGIKIYPIASSGLNAQGEYIFRQLAQVTNGRFIFLTPEAAESTPNGDLTLADYTVAALDALIVAIIAEELAPQTP